MVPASSGLVSLVHHLAAPHVTRARVTVLVHTITAETPETLNISPEQSAAHPLSPQVQVQMCLGLQTAQNSNLGREPPSAPCKQVIHLLSPWRLESEFMIF